MTVEEVNTSDHINPPPIPEPVFNKCQMQGNETNNSSMDSDGIVDNIKKAWNDTRQQTMSNIPQLKEIHKEIEQEMEENKNRCVELKYYFMREIFTCMQQLETDGGVNVLKHGRKIKLSSVAWYNLIKTSVNFPSERRMDSIIKTALDQGETTPEKYIHKYIQRRFLRKVHTIVSASLNGGIRI